VQTIKNHVSISALSPQHFKKQPMHHIAIPTLNLAKYGSASQQKHILKGREDPASKVYCV